jgi:hypothetical protein
MMSSYQYARRVMSNPHPYYENVAPGKHSEVKPEWIERPLVAPHHRELAVDGDLVSWGRESSIMAAFPWKGNG